MVLAQEQFADLAAAQMDTIYRRARRLSRDASGADDLVQDTFLRAIRFRSTFELREFGIRPWLLRILNCVHCNQLNRDRHWHPLLENFSEHPDLSQIKPPVESDPYGLETMDDRLVGAINSLSAPFRDVLLLWAIDDLTYQEIADHLHVPLGTVMSRLYRARKLLRRQIGKPRAARRILAD